MVKGSEEFQQLGLNRTALCDLQGVIFLTSSVLVSPLEMQIPLLPSKDFYEH